MADMNKIKEHPGFMPFGWANKKAGTAEEKPNEKKE